jgi:hypothetical protein
MHSGLLGALRVGELLYIAKTRKPRARVLPYFSFLLLFQMVPDGWLPSQGALTGGLGRCYFWLAAPKMIVSQAAPPRLNTGAIWGFCRLGLATPGYGRRNNDHSVCGDNGCQMHGENVPLRGEIMADIRLRLIDWRRVREGRLYGFAEVEPLPAGLLLHQVPVLMSRRGVPWACMPTKPRLDADGRQMREFDGTPRYEQVVTWSRQRRAREFSAAVVELVRRTHPQDLA